MFEVGDGVVHPARGAGVVTGIEELMQQGARNLYYTIKLLDQPESCLMVPVERADTVGLRPPISKTRLKRVWRTLRQDPGDLPEERKERQSMLEDKLITGDVLQLAELVRDMFWRKEADDGLTARSQKIYTRGMVLLAGEIAVAEGIELDQAQENVETTLEKRVSSSSDQ